jgi:hypothetical protein
MKPQKLYWQRCAVCGVLSTPDCEGHICHKCGKAKYQQYVEYKSALQPNDAELVRSDMQLDWTQQQEELLGTIFSAVDGMMLHCERTQSVKEWNALHPIRERLNHILLGITFKNTL